MTLDPGTTIGLIVATKQQELEMRGNRPLKFRRPRRQRVPLSLERSYTKELRANAELAKALIDELLIPRLGEIQRMAGIRDDGSRLDVENWAATLATIFSTVRQRMAAVNVRAPEQQAELFGGQVSGFNREEVRRQMRGVLGVDIFLNEPQLGATLANFTADNVSLITSISDRYFGEVEGIVSRGFRGGRRAAELIPQIRDRFGVTQSRATLIARDQISKLNGQLTRQRQTSLGIDDYIWRTSRDERVRESHRRLEGTTQSWDEPPIVAPGRREHPGGDFRCRCGAEPVIPGVEAIKTTPSSVKRAKPKPKKVRAPQPTAKTLKPGEAPPRGERFATMPRTGRRVPLSRGQARARQNAAALNNSRAARRAASFEQRRDFYQWNWVHSSSRKNSVLMKKAASREFGLRGIAYNPHGFAHAAGDVADAAEDLRRVYEETQTEFRRRGIKTIKVFRGVKGPVAERGAVESWTTDRKVAEKFGTYGVKEEEVPVERILTGRGLPGWVDGIFGDQGEMVVLF